MSVEADHATTPGVDVKSQRDVRRHDGIGPRSSGAAFAVVVALVFLGTSCGGDSDDLASGDGDETPEVGTDSADAADGGETDGADGDVINDGSQTDSGTDSDGTEDADDDVDTDGDPGTGDDDGSSDPDADTAISDGDEGADAEADGEADAGGLTGNGGQQEVEATPAFCEAANEFVQLDENPATAEEGKETVEELIAIVGRIRDSAPPEAADSAEEMARFVEEVGERAASVDYDPQFFRDNTADDIADEFDEDLMGNALGVAFEYCDFG